MIRAEAMGSLVSELLPLALVLTPNIPEAEALSGMKINTMDDMKEAGEKILRMGPKYVVVKGGHLEGEAADLLCGEGGFQMFRAPRFATGDTHGTGCTFSAAIATFLAAGKDVPAAVAGAKHYISEAIRRAWRIGGGHGPTNHLAPLFADGPVRLPDGWNEQWNEVASEK